MKLNELKASLVEVPPSDTGDVCCEDDSYDDFYEALELLELCKRHISAVLQYGSVSEGRRQVLNGLCDDIGQFVSTFVEGEV